MTIKLQAGKTYLTGDGRQAYCIGFAADGHRAAVVIAGRKMIETYGPDGTFRLDSDKAVDERLHIVSEYREPVQFWAVIADTGAICEIRRDPGFSDATLAKGRVVLLREDREI